MNPPEPTLSRQRKWQLERRARGLCTICGAAPLATTNCCLTHAIAVRERQRVRLHSRRRYRSKTYKITQLATA